MRIAVYTCITDNYLPLVDPAFVNPDVDYICFMDDETFVLSGHFGVWQYSGLKPFFANPIRNARLPKILSHRYLTGYDYTIWIDASMQLMVDPVKLVEKLESWPDLRHGAVLGAFENSRRERLADEFKAIRESKWGRKGRVDLKLLAEQEAEYSHRSGLYKIYYGGLIVRKQCESATDLNNEWFKEYCLWQHRDQPSMNYAIIDRGYSGLTNVPLPGTPKENEFTRWLK